MGLSSFKFVQWAPKDASFLQQSAFWPFKVIQSRWFWYQSKARMRLPISLSLWLRSYLAPFLRYGDLLAKNCLFFLPLSHSAPSFPMFPLEFCAKLTMRKLESWGYLQWRPYDRSLSCFDTVPACDGRTDGQTDGRFTIAITALCIASYADVL